MRPMLLGMNNPLSDDPKYDLYPDPEGSTGWHLWKMMPEGTTRGQYLDMFERRNLLHALVWDQKKAHEAAQALLPELDGRTVVVLGTQVCAALGLPLAEPLSTNRFRLGASSLGYLKFDWVTFPHPSEHNKWFNQPKNMDRARDMLQNLVGS